MIRALSLVLLVVSAAGFVPFLPSSSIANVNDSTPSWRYALYTCGALIGGKNFVFALSPWSEWEEWGTNFYSIGRTETDGEHYLGPRQGPIAFQLSPLSVNEAEKRWPNLRANAGVPDAKKTDIRSVTGYRNQLDGMLYEDFLVLWDDRNAVLGFAVSVARGDVSVPAGLYPCFVGTSGKQPNP